MNDLTWQQRKIAPAIARRLMDETGMDGYAAMAVVRDVLLWEEHSPHWDLVRPSAGQFAADVMTPAAAAVSTAMDQLSKGLARMTLAFAPLIERGIQAEAASGVALLEADLDAST